MKKLLAMLLALAMVLALVPAAIAEDADYTLVIEGGDVNEHTQKVDGKNLLAVQVTLDEAIEETIFGLTFDITYDKTQVTYVDFEADDAFSMPTINSTEEGILRCALVSVEGIAAADSADVITLYFEVAEELEAGTEIAFELAKGAFAETTDAAKPVQHDIAANFAPFVISEEVLFNGVVKFNEGEVQYKGETPYVIWDHAAGQHEPAFTVYEEDGETVIDPANYDYEYKENTLPGTGYLFVYFKGEYAGTADAQLFFKIYLPATTETYVENVAEGIRVTWKPVEGAAGYVIYRRAWGALADGWTAFARWDNTTETTWLDGHDDAHKVYAGTRYQYGVKAYFAERVDPVSGAKIGGNVNADSGNFNLGEIGPLKTTVRITTRELRSVASEEAGKLTVKWMPSQYFTGIQIQWATDENFKQNANAVRFEWADENGSAIWKYIAENLTSGTTYYVRIRSYHMFGGMIYFGGWSNVLSGETK